MQKIGDITYVASNRMWDEQGRPFGWHVAGYKKSLAEDAKNLRKRIRDDIRKRLDRLGVGNNDFPSREAAEAIIARFSAMTPAEFRAWQERLDLSQDDITRLTGWSSATIVKYRKDGEKIPLSAQLATEAVEARLARG